MLERFDHHGLGIEGRNLHQWLFETGLHYFVSEIMETLDIDDADEIERSLSRTFQVCDTLRISVSRNFKRVYRYDGHNMIADWKISSLACYLIVINSNPGNERVAKAQLYFAMKMEKVDREN